MSEPELGPEPSWPRVYWVSIAGVIVYALGGLGAIVAAYLWSTTHG
jgi:uncharacterized protein involved in exopolysaccharide biosynthesis